MSFLNWNSSKGLTYANDYTIIQKQPSRGVHGFENMQQIYRRRSRSKCDFNDVESNFIEITLRHGCSPVNCWIFSEHDSLKTPLDSCFWLYHFAFSKEIPLMLLLHKSTESQIHKLMSFRYIYLGHTVLRWLRIMFYLRSHLFFNNLLILKFHEICCHRGVHAILNL